MTGQAWLRLQLRSSWVCACLERTDDTSPWCTSASLPRETISGRVWFTYCCAHASALLTLSRSNLSCGQTSFAKRDPFPPSALESVVSDQLLPSPVAIEGRNTSRSSNDDGSLCLCTRPSFWPNSKYRLQGKSPSNECPAFRSEVKFSLLYTKYS